MKYLRASTAVAVLVLLAAAGSSMCLRSQSVRQLHLVTGMRTQNWNFKVESAVFAVDPAQHTLTRVADLVDAQRGISFIHEDLDRRLIVVGSPDTRPAEAVVLSMDAPSTPRAVPVALDEGSLETYLLSGPNGPALALDTFRNGKRRLLGLGLFPADPSNAMRDLAWEDYRFIRRMGYWDPGDLPGGRFELAAKDGRLISNQGGTAVDLGVPVPKAFESEADQTFLLAVNNDAMLVVDRSKERGKGAPGPAGSTRLSVYDKAGQSWHTVTFEGGGSSVRGFGAWIAVNEAEIRRDLSKPIVERDREERESPGRALRQRALNPRERSANQTTVDALFEDSPLYTPGTLHLYDVRSNKRYRIDTSQGDSEVLLIEGMTVYYRVNDTLFRAQIRDGKVEGPVELVRDDNVQLAHWAFFGP